MNSNATRGSISEEVVRRKRRLAWFTLKTSVDGFVFGRYMSEGLGAGCARKSGRSCEADKGRFLYVWETSVRLHNEVRSRSHRHYRGSGYFILVILKDMYRLYNAGHDAERKCDNTANR